MQARLETTALPPSWVIAPSSPAVGSLVLCKLRHDSSHSIANVLFTITISCDLEWHVTCGNHLNLSNSRLLSSLSPMIGSFHDLVGILETLDLSRLCVGNGEERFLDVVTHRNSTLQGTF